MLTFLVLVHMFCVISIRSKFSLAPNLCIVIPKRGILKISIFWSWCIHVGFLNQVTAFSLGSSPVRTFSNIAHRSFSQGYPSIFTVILQRIFDLV